MEYKYRFEPAESSVYRVLENSCFMTVVFDGLKKGIYSKMDRQNEEIGYLLCCICDKDREIVEVSSDFFQTYYQQVLNSPAQA
ncbi:MAG: hypothetical protein WDO16_10930 [Bacteroidota bacterium]